MHVISRPATVAAQARHPDAADWLEAWYRTAKHVQWTGLENVQEDYQATDQVGGCLVFNCRGNKYRFIVGVRFAQEERGGTLFVKHFLTHAEYTKDRWKASCNK